MNLKSSQRHQSLPGGETQQAFLLAAGEASRYRAASAMKPSTAKRMSSSARRGVTQRDGSGRKLISQIELLRMRVAAAEAAWKETKEQASQAKRRRKLARLMARRAKKDAKSAKSNLDEMREALARAEAQSALARRRAVSRKIRKAKTPGAHSKKQASSTPRRVRKSPRAARSPSVREPTVAPAESIPGPVDGAASPPPAEEIPVVPGIERTDL
jgi:chromosome segregation ATPase